MASSQRILQILCLLCLHMLAVTSSLPEIAVIGVVFKVTSPNECTEVDPSGVYSIESLQWMVDYLNRHNYIKNVKLEIDVVDICQPESSIHQTIKLMTKYKTGPKKLIGILGMTTSEKMLKISWFLSNLPPNLRLIQIGTASTANQLNDRSRYPTYFRVIPDDTVQIQLIVKLLIELKWNYIAILYERDAYGIEGAKILSKSLPSHGITLATKLAIYDINEQIFILSSDYPHVQGVVIIAQLWTLKKMKKAKVKNWHRFILTESVEIDNSFDNLELFKLATSVKIPQVSFPDIEQHWEMLLNATDIKDKPFFQKMIEQSLVCPDALNSTCSQYQVAKRLSTGINKKSMLLKIIGLYTFAFMLKMKLEKCQKTPCSPLILELENIQNQTIDFSYLSQILHHSPINTTGVFNEQGNLVLKGGFRAYDVYNNMRNDKTNNFEFQEVGYYDGHRLTLDMSNLRELEFWGTCPKGKNCRTGDFPKFIYKKGDIMLFGIVPVLSGNNPLSCPRYQDLTPSKLSGEQLAEAMFYAVEQLNQGKIYKNLFAGKKVGIVLMDSCNEQIQSFKRILSFNQGTANICQTKLECANIKRKILVYIGALTSEVSIRIAQLMVSMKTIQISYGSTSSVFRDPLSYENPNFIRLTPSDNLQIAAMIDICVKMKWLYISMIFTNNAYGRSAERELRSKAKHHKICVTLSLSFKKGDSSEHFLKELKRRPEAKVVIVFINSADLELFMKSLTNTMKEKDFIFLGSEAWGRFLRTDQFGDKIAGSLSLAIDIPADQAFENYLKQKQLGKGSDNPWREAAMEGQCYKPLSLNKFSKKPCEENITLYKLRNENQWSPMVIQSVYAAAVGLSMSIAQLCKNVEVCPELFNKTEKVMDIFKSVKLKGGDGKEKRVFNDEGDGTLSYAIYKIQKINNEYDYIKIGKWSQASGLTIDTKQIHVPPLECPNKKRCKECALEEDSSAPLENYIPVVIVFVILLLVLFGAVIFIYWKYTRRGNHVSLERDTINRRDEVSNVYVMANAVDDKEETHVKKIYKEATISENRSRTIPKALVSATDSINPAFDEAADGDV